MEDSLRRESECFWKGPKKENPPPSRIRKPARLLLFLGNGWSEAEHPRCWDTMGGREGIDDILFYFLRNTNWDDPFYSKSSSIASLSTQPRDLSTALLQRLNHFSLVLSSVIGLNVLRLSRLMPLSSSNPFHRFTANPAAIAAPSAVVSRIWGRSTSIPVVSHSFQLVY